MFKPRTIIAGRINPCATITSEISDIPVTAAPAAPKTNINEFPKKNAIILIKIACLALRPKRTKSAVNEPALMKEPTTKVIAIGKEMSSFGMIFSNTDKPPASVTAKYTE